MKVGDVVIHNGHEGRLLVICKLVGEAHAECSWMEPGWGRQEATLPLKELRLSNHITGPSGQKLRLVGAKGNDEQ